MMMIIQSLRRVIRKYVSAYYISLRNCSQKFVELSSDLYICGEHREKVFSTLDPYIDVDGYFNNITKLKSDLKNRNIIVDVDDLQRQCITYKTSSVLIKTTMQDIKEMQKELKKMSFASKEDGGIVEKSSALESKLCETKNKLIVAKHKFEDLEKSFIIPFLKLPNNLHKNTGKQDETLFSLFPKPQFSFPAKSHIEIGLLKKELCFQDVSPTSYFMKGCLALLELTLGDYVLSRFKELGFRNYRTTDVVKSMVAEGCGMDTKTNGRKTLKIVDFNNFYSNHTQILVGSASLPSLIVLLHQATLNFTSDSPIRFISVGQKYHTPTDTRPAINFESLKGLFTAIQSTCASGLVAYPGDMSEESVVNEVAMMLTQIYTELGLHFILIQYGAPRLRVHESLAVGVCMYSPYFKTYVEVGRISLCQDYISKRLQIYQSLEKKKAIFLGMVFVEILNMKNWIGCMMENTQTSDGDYLIPECLEPYMFK